MICAVLIPSRKRVERLIKCVESFFAHGNCNEFEVWIGTDDDDPATTHAAVKLEERFEKVFHLERPRGNGWHDLHLRYTELADQSPAEWVWMMNDDCEVRGRANWTNAIGKRSVGILHPETYQLGCSLYYGDRTGAFPIVRNGIWRDMGFVAMEFPPDKWLNDQHRERHYPIHFLHGVEIDHQRRADEILPAERL
jgi:hypothetical protein